jgi:hypothetical protein
VKLNGKKIVFLSDTPPLKNKGSGISVLLFNILLALGNEFKINIITFCGDSKASPNEIISDNNGHDVFLCDGYLYRFYKLLYFNKLKKVFQFISFIFSLPKLSHRFNKADFMFVTLIGASIRPVYKAWILMKLAPKASHSLYIVDDLELINRRAKNNFELFLISIFFRRTISNSNFIITITEGLKNAYKERYNIDCLVLLPHYKKINPLKVNSTASEDFVFLFTGGLSFLYNETLKLFSLVLQELNINNFTVKFRLIVQTYSDYNYFISLGFDSSIVQFSTSLNRDELKTVYEKCDCFIIPYSFDKNNKGMVATSFPQKTAELIQYGKPIFILGPEYGSTVQFFKQKNLAYFCCDSSFSSIKSSVTNIFQNNKNFKFEAYKTAYNDSLSSYVVINLFKAILK